VVSFFFFFCEEKLWFPVTGQIRVLFFKQIRVLLMANLAVVYKLRLLTQKVARANSTDTQVFILFYFILFIYLFIYYLTIFLVNSSVCFDYRGVPLLIFLCFQRCL
jgi:hypothetical protein